MPIFSVVDLPFCSMVLVGRWDAPAHRYFLAYRAGLEYRWLLGHPVVDEFATFSSPIFLAPQPLLGKIYNAGISLGHRRDAEMAIDLGWPPLCVGLDLPLPALPNDWEERLLAALRQKDPARDRISRAEVRTRRAGGYDLSGCRVGEARVIGTSAPLLPRQLRRLCEVAGGPLAMAFSTGNRINRRTDGAPQTLRAVSEVRLQELTGSVEALWTAPQNLPEAPSTQM